jgi:hypothetical protein
LLKKNPIKAEGSVSGRQYRQMAAESERLPSGRLRHDSNSSMDLRRWGADIGLARIIEKTAGASVDELMTLNIKVISTEV